MNETAELLMLIKLGKESLALVIFAYTDDKNESYRATDLFSYT